MHRNDWLSVGYSLALKARNTHLVFLRLGTLSFGGPAAHMNILDDRYRSSGAVNTACPDARYR